jgi:hypothetical protein
MGNRDDVLDKMAARIDAGELAGPRVVRSSPVKNTETPEYLWVQAQTK